MPFYQSQMNNGFQSLQPALSTLAHGLALRGRPDYVQARANMQDPSAWLGDEGWRAGTPDYIKNSYSLYVDPNKAGDLIVLQKGAAPPSNYKPRDDYGSLLTLPGWQSREASQRLVNPQSPPTTGQPPTLDPFQNAMSSLVTQPRQSLQGMPSNIQALGFGPAPQNTPAPQPSLTSDPVDLLSKLQATDLQGASPWFHMGENLGSFTSQDMANAQNTQQTTQANPYAEKYTQLQQKFNTSKGDQEINISNDQLPQYTSQLGMLLKELATAGVSPNDPLRARIGAELVGNIQRVRDLKNDPQLFQQFDEYLPTTGPAIGQAYGEPIPGITDQYSLGFDPALTKKNAPLSLLEGLTLQKSQFEAAPNTTVFLPQLQGQTPPVQEIPVEVPGQPPVTPQQPTTPAPVAPPSNQQPVSYTPQYEQVPAQMGYRHSYQPMNMPWEQLQGLPAEAQLALMQQYANTQGIPQENRFGAGGLVDPNYQTRNQQRAQTVNTLQGQYQNANVTKGQQLDNQFNQGTMQDRQRLIQAQVKYNEAMAENMKAQAQQGGLSVLDIAKLQNLQMQTQKLREDMLRAPVQALEKSLASSAALLKQGKGDTTTHSKLLLEYAMRKDAGLLSKSPEEIQKSIVEGNIVPADFWSFLPWASKSGKLTASDVGSVRDQILMELYGGGSTEGGSAIDWNSFAE